MNAAIEDTFAEAFPITAARVVVTAETPGWARTAGQTATGYAASVIGCDAEAGIERDLPPNETPDGRPTTVGRRLGQLLETTIGFLPRTRWDRTFQIIR